MIPRNSPIEWLPIDHRAPLPRIETAPRYTPAPQLIPKLLQYTLDHAERMNQIKEGDRIWAITVDIAKGG